jgi:hypothetical protein
VGTWIYGDFMSGFKTYQVVTEELHDEGGVLVALLAEGVELCRLC